MATLVFTAVACADNIASPSSRLSSQPLFTVRDTMLSPSLPSRQETPNPRCQDPARVVRGNWFLAPCQTQPSCPPLASASAADQTAVVQSKPRMNMSKVPGRLERCRFRSSQRAAISSTRSGSQSRLLVAQSVTPSRHSKPDAVRMTTVHCGPVRKMRCLLYVAAKE